MQKVYVVGLGPGGVEQMTARAKNTLKKCFSGLDIGPIIICGLHTKLKNLQIKFTRMRGKDWQLPFPRLRIILRNDVKSKMNRVIQYTHLLFEAAALLGKFICFYWIMIWESDNSWIIIKL